MSRYLERAEHIARLLDVSFNMELDLRGLLAGPPEMQWSGLLAILQQQMPSQGHNGQSPQTSIRHWLMFDLDNPNSILSCVSRARSNARQIRGTINAEMWRELNKLYWQLRDADFIAHARESPHDFYQVVEIGNQMFQGITDATLTHDEGWQFIQLGKFLERAEKTLRILDIQYHLLRQMLDPADLPLSNLQWAGVLRACRAYHAYQRVYVGRVDPDRVVEFLLLNPEFPRSVRFALEKASRALEEVESLAGGRDESRSGRLFGRLLSDLRFAELPQILAGDFHAFLGDLQTRCASASRAVQEQYALR
jgi:uncharacterized alpha-E superfamily protein